MEIKAFLEAPDGWDSFVNEHKNGKIYHSTVWNDMVKTTFGHQIYYITLTENQKITGVLPLTDFKSLLFGRLAVSQPFVNYGGPLLSNDDQIEPLMQFLESFRVEKGFKSIEIRQGEALNTGKPCKQHKVTFFLDLPADPDELFNGFKAKLRSQIRRPMKDEMTGKTGGLELLDEFYKVFTINMRDLGTPPLPRRFFENILKTFPEEAFIGVVYAANGDAAAASFLIKYGDIMEIPWASSLREYNRSSPNMLLYWESLKLSIEKGCKRFDYGRCTPDSGTYRFKKQWGAEESPLYWYYILPEKEELPEMNPDNSKFDMFIKIWQKMPLSFTNSVGPLVIKHIP